MNEELQASNDELHRSGVELNEVNAFLEGVFATLRGGVAVLDREQRVLVWNARAEELWGMRASEVVGTSFLELDIGLPVARVAESIRNSMNGTPTSTVVLDATNRRGRRITCRVTTTALPVDDGVARGVIVVMEELDAAG